MTTTVSCLKPGDTFFSPIARSRFAGKALTVRELEDAPYNMITIHASWDDENVTVTVEADEVVEVIES